MGHRSRIPFPVSASLSHLSPRGDEALPYLQSTATWVGGRLMVAERASNVVPLRWERCLRSGCWLAKIAQMFKEAK